MHFGIDKWLLSFFEFLGLSLGFSSLLPDFHHHCQMMPLNFLKALHLRHLNLPFSNHSFMPLVPMNLLDPPLRNNDETHENHQGCF